MTRYTKEILRPIALVGVFALLLTCCLHCSDGEDSRTDTGDADSVAAQVVDMPDSGEFGAPTDSVQTPQIDYSFTDIEGVTFSISEFSGSVVMVCFFMTDDAQCVEWLDTVKQLSTDFRQDGLEIIGVVMNMAGKDKLRRFRQRHRLPFTPVQGSGKYSFGMGVGGALPITYIFDQNGVLRSRIIGAKDLELYQDEIEYLLEGN
jgi:peroxiredoxin